MDYNRLLADRTEKMGVNAIREILKVVSLPGMVSLAGGIPAPESFPMDIMKMLAARVIDKYGSSAFQYDPTEGFPPLRPVLADYLSERGVKASADEIIVHSGSQGVLDGLGKVLISKGDAVAVEAPTYLGALQAFNPYEPEYVRLDMDESGLVPESLEDVLKKNKVKFTYLAPTFQNPTGRTIPLERRMKIADILKKHDALLVEDDPYSELRYLGSPVATIKSLAPENVVYISTLSKVFAPGLRLGFCSAPKEIQRWLVLVKQGVDLHTSTFTQALAAEYIAGGHLKDHLPEIIKLYTPRLKAILKALADYFPDNFTWSKPEGGMFIWVCGPKGLDAEELYYKAIERKVAFVPGKFFFTDPEEGHETMRLNFTMADEETLERTIKKLSEIIA